MNTTVASAPGKVILFGEHAVVHGITAIAAALSDLRIFVEINSSSCKELTLFLYDIKINNKEYFQITYPTEILTQISKNQGNEENTFIPSPATVELLKEIVDTNVDSAAQCVMATLYLISQILKDFIPKDSGVIIKVRSVGLPIGAGLGSSAAFSVALSGALFRFKQLIIEKHLGHQMLEIWKHDISDLSKPVQTNLSYTIPPQEALEVINQWAYAAEVVIHGSPSGLDNTTSCFGGAVKFSKRPGAGFTKLKFLPNITILLTNTLVPRRTSDLVAKVGNLYKKYPEIVKSIFDAIENISQHFLRLIDQNEISDLTIVESEISDLIRINHNLLCTLGVGHPALTSVVDIAQSQGFATKLTGAGGGGCAITLIPSMKQTLLESSNYSVGEKRPLSDISFNQDITHHSGNIPIVEELIDKLSDRGYDSAASLLGGVGVKWHT